MKPKSLARQALRRTVLGLAKSIYANQLITSRRAGRPLLTYTAEQLHDWLVAQPVFTSLYAAWIASGYDKELSPSVDQLRNHEGYSLGNIQLVT